MPKFLLLRLLEEQGFGIMDFDDLLLEMLQKISTTMTTVSLMLNLEKCFDIKKYPRME